MNFSFYHSDNIKNRSWWGKKNSGFSLLELMVVVIIAIILSTITLLNFPLFSARQSLQISAEEVAQTIREAQLYGISIKTLDGSTAPSPAYGIFVSATVSSSAITPLYQNTVTIFTDRNGDEVYNAGGTCGSATSECVRKVELRQPTKLKTLCYHHTGIFDNKSADATADRGYLCGSSQGFPVRDITVLFKRPNPEPEKIIVNSFSGAVTPINYAKIVLESPDGAQKSIYVSRAGQIAVNNFGRLPAGGCPAIFSQNGDQFLFEHEAVPFALGKFFEGTSFTRLENTKPENQKLTIRIAEEKDEVSFIDKVGLKAVDIPKGSGEVLPGEDGTLHVVGNKKAPIVCTEKEGVSCAAESSESDNLYFSLGPNNESFLTFDPTGTKDARFVLSAKANPLAEESAFTYGALIKPALTFAELLSPLSSFPKERILDLVKDYKVAIDIKEEDGWREVGVRNFGDGKSFIMEINSPVLLGTKPVEIRLRSLGWYLIDSVYLDSTPKPEIIIHDLATDALPEGARELDENYTVLKKGESVDVTFSLPKENDDYERFFIFSLSGYYEMVGKPSITKSLVTIGRFIPGFLNGGLPKNALTKDIFKNVE